MTPPPNLPTATDLEVVALARQGREEGYRELLRRYQRRVYGLMCHTVDDRELAQDLTQEVFAKVFRALEDHPPERGFATWMFRIAQRTATDYLRRRERTPLPLDDQPDVTPSGPAKPLVMRLANKSEPSTSRSGARKVAAGLEQAIKRLPVKYRRCARLRLIEERSYDDIAETLHLPVGTVATYLHRARKELRRMLGPLLDSVP
jgi:RNA polymerase sigma-70 factor (ECF subfamily)